MAKKINKKLPYKISLPILAVVTLLVAIVIYKSGNIEYKNEVTYIAPRVPAEQQNPIAQRESPVPEPQFNLDYLFDEKPVNTGKPYGYSNVVGYFARGAFAWYVPGWLEEDWFINNNANDEGMTITPKKPITNSPISDIVLTVSTSTETFNAATLFEFQKENALITSEVLLNKHTEGGVTILIETNTRIYHVQKEVGERIVDLYFMDGNNMTLSVSFSALKEYFPAVAPKIREMIQGIGEVKGPQG